MQMQDTGDRPPAAEGDLSVLKGSGPLSEAAGAPREQQPGGAAAGASRTEAQVQQLVDITGASADECRVALEQAGGNVDLAAGQLMGW